MIPEFVHCWTREATLGRVEAFSRCRALSRISLSARVFSPAAYRATLLDDDKAILGLIRKSFRGQGECHALDRQLERFASLEKFCDV